MDFVEFLKLMATEDDRVEIHARDILLEYAGDNSNCDICPFYEECAGTLGRFELRYCSDFLAHKLDMSSILL